MQAYWMHQIQKHLTHFSGLSKSKSTKGNKSSHRLETLLSFIRGFKSNHMRDLGTTENEWVSQSQNQVGSPSISKTSRFNLNLILQELKVLFLSI